MKNLSLSLHLASVTILVLLGSLKTTESPSEHKAQITRPLLESGMQTFGSWIQRLDWHQVLEATGTQNKADAFYEILDLGMNTCFPEKKNGFTLMIRAG